MTTFAVWTLDIVHSVQCIHCLVKYSDSYTHRHVREIEREGEKKKIDTKGNLKTSPTNKKWKQRYTLSERSVSGSKIKLQ